MAETASSSSPVLERLKENKTAHTSGRPACVLLKAGLEYMYSQQPCYNHKTPVYF